MLALRQGAARFAPRRLQCLRTTKRFASSGGHAGVGHNVEEPLGTGFWIFVTILPFGCGVYYISRPGANGELPALTRWANQFWHLNDLWQERAIIHENILRQAAFDRLVFYTAPKEGHYELRYPEVFQSHARRNIAPGDLINLDAVTERYRKQHLEEEERKMKKLAAESKALAEKRA